MMKVLEQGSWINYTNRLNDNELISQAMFLSTRFECSATLVATSKGFKITQAYYSIHRCRDKSKRREGDIPELIGGSAHYDGGKAVKALPDFGDDGKVEELLLECIRGFEQAETYLLDELGMKTREEYEAYWQTGKENHCRPYWGRMPGLDEWSKHIGAYDYTRTKNLYNKRRSYVIIQRNDNQIEVSSSYSDSFHDLYSELKYNVSDYVISDFDMVLNQAPHKQCFDLSHTLSESFVGKSILDLKKRDIGKIIGGAEGCWHLVSIVSDMALAVMERNEQLGAHNG